MKREGRQRGMVRSYPILSEPWNPLPKPRYLNQLSSPPTAGLFTKAPTKPTNHSKFTGKCGRPGCRNCHIHPASKSKDKAKGAHKKIMRSSHGLISWRVVDAAPQPGFKFSGFSASGVLDYLDHDGVNDHYDDDDDCNECCGHEVIESHGVEIEGIEDDDDEVDRMSFCEVGFVLQVVDDGDESWCFVEEM